jgi:uncharacterized protein (DUF2147 family)
MKFKQAQHNLLVTLLSLSLIAPVIAAAEAASSKDVRGLWVDNRDSEKQKFAVWVEDCGTQLCGKIYWLKKPNFDNGEPKYDKHNPDESLQNRPLCGLKILTGFQYTKDSTWKNGQIYNPSDGRTFNSFMTLKEDGSLRVKGYVGLTLFGKSVEWVRPKENLQRCS